MAEHLGDIPAVCFEVNDPGRGAVSVATPVGKDELVTVGEGELVCPGLFPSTAGAVDEDDGRAGGLSTGRLAGEDGEEPDHGRREADGERYRTEILLVAREEGPFLHVHRVAARDVHRGKAGLPRQALPRQARRPRHSHRAPGRSSTT